MIVNNFSKVSKKAILKKYCTQYPLLVLFPIIYLLGKINKYFLKHNNKILIMHFGGIGDVLMCTPAVRLLRKCYPNSKINFIVADRTATAILKRNQDVNEIQFFHL